MRVALATWLPAGPASRSDRGLRWEEQAATKTWGIHMTSTSPHQEPDTRRCRRSERERRMGGHRSCAGTGRARRIRLAGTERQQHRVGDRPRPDRQLGLSHHGHPVGPRGGELDVHPAGRRDGGRLSGRPRHRDARRFERGTRGPALRRQPGQRHSDARSGDQHPETLPRMRGNGPGSIFPGRVQPAFASAMTAAANRAGPRGDLPPPGSAGRFPSHHVMVSANTAPSTVGTRSSARSGRGVRSSSGPARHVSA
jgi:hypothetical protein